ncbi:MAG: hypothetical protein A2W35_06820 [Chloroflexi bacterium RBG_16_57_11]|nr:MAG: hypothetical protein A2W35_06820 [Chloroflexi bacterium RBG_16_57_11]
MAVRTSEGYFVFHPHVQLVRGSSGAAVHELFKRKVYWLRQPAIVHALSQLALGDSICNAAIAAAIDAQDLATHLAVLSDLGLGAFMPTRSATELYRPLLLHSQAEEFLAPRDGGSLTIEISGECIYFCPWCTSKTTLTPFACACGVWSDQGPPLPLNRLLAAVEQLRYAGVDYLIVRGGEPLLVADRLCDLILAACRLGMQCEVHSTGVLLSEDIVNRLRGLPVHFILLIPTKEKVLFDQAVDRPGSWVKLLQAISALTSAGISFSTKIPAHLADLESANATAMWANDLGATNNSLLYYLAATGGSSEELVRAFRLGSPQAMAVGLEDFVINGQSQFCFDNSYFITGDGRLMPCIARRTPLASLAETDMATILREDQLEPVRHTARHETPACRACEFRLGCRACLVRTEQLTGSVGSRHWNCAYEPETGTWQ